jgi:hypothetical protein
MNQTGTCSTGSRRQARMKGDPSWRLRVSGPTAPGLVTGVVITRV